MLSRDYLSARRCVRDLIGVLSQVEWRVAARAPVAINDSLTGLLLLWTILRGERTFLLRALEQLGVDMWALTRDLDELINQTKAQQSPLYSRDPMVDPSSWSFQHLLDPLLCTWLDRAQQQALAWGHRYLGTEHLLLAILAAPDARLASLLARHGLEHEKVKAAVLEALSRSPPVAAELVAERAGQGRGAAWDAPGVGVPRRFSLAMLMMMMALYAVLFAAMQVLGTPPVAFVAIALFFTVVGVAQAVLFGGKRPRAASIWTGAVLLPLAHVGLFVYLSLTLGPSGLWRPDVCAFPAFVLVWIPLGALCGYLAGCLAAGMFCLADWYEKKRASRPAPERPGNDPFADEVPKADDSVLGT